MKLVSLQGNVYLAERDANGDPVVFRHLGNVPNIEVALESNTAEHFESTSGQRLQDGRLIIGKTAGVTIDLDEWTKKNLALALYGVDNVITGASVTGEPVPNPIAQGDFHRLAYQDVSALVITDSAGTPATLVEGVDYEITSAKHGTIKFIADLSGYTQPFTADYTYGDATSIAMFDSAPTEKWLMVDGVNTAEANAPVKAELYRVIFDPVGSMNLIHNEGYGPMQLTGSALYDSTKVGDAELGQFGRMVEVG